MNNMQFAAYYAIRGWRVLPVYPIRDGKCACSKGRDCTSPGKHPLVARWTDNSTISIGQIQSWWGDIPDANIAIHTGTSSGVWSLDVDGSEGITTMLKLQTKYGLLPRTFWWITGGGGYQILFNYPEGHRVRNGVRIFPSVDSRGQNGYVLAPPSNHVSGGIYRYSADFKEHFSGVQVANAPEWLLDVVTREPEVVLTPGNGGLMIDDGRRNSELFSMGAKLRREFPGVGIETVLAFLEAINKHHCESPLEDSEIKLLANNILKYAR